MIDENCIEYAKISAGSFFGEQELAVLLDDKEDNKEENKGDNQNQSKDDKKTPVK